MPRQVRDDADLIRVLEDFAAAKLQTLGINMDQQMLSKIENNSRMVTDYELAGMCLALRVSPAELLTDFFREYSEQ